VSIERMCAGREFQVEGADREKSSNTKSQCAISNEGVIRRLQDLSNAIHRTFVRHFAQFQLTRRAARSLGDSRAYSF